MIRELNDRFTQALIKAFGAEIIPSEPLVVAASNPRFGDYQCNVSLSLTKVLGENPRAIALQIIEQLQITDICLPPEIAGPGFINLTLQPDYISDKLLNIYQDQEHLGIELAQPRERIIVDFSSPNIAKEMHVGHLRSTIIGDCIARILEFRGHQVLRLNHVGDWGTQFGMLIAYLREAYPEALVKKDALLLGDLVTFYKQAKLRFDQDEAFGEIARQEVVKLQSGNEESRRAWELLCEQSRREFQVIYDLLDITIVERGESFYNPYLAEIVAALDAKGLLTTDDGAKCVFLTGFTNKQGDPLPLIVQKSDGGYNYATTDLAAIKYRTEKDGAQKIIYVTDIGQSNHFAQVFQIAQRAGFLPPEVKVIHVPFGLVLGEDGKKVKTRSGDTIRLRDLLDEAIARARQDLITRLSQEERTETEAFITEVAQVIGISAVKYADLSQNRTSNYVFSYDKMLALQGNTAPYLLYAYVRVQGIIRKGNIDFQEIENNLQILLDSTAEQSLAKHILQFNDLIQEVEIELLPNRLSQYLFELSQKFNQFYDQCPILQATESLRISRLILAELTARTLKLGLSLLGISVLNRL
ncbi:arginine--tRNA ligase [Gloeocapsa sp. PCC 73106]|uniref:arginine--tRNA ligase n=1 Tax=Gloeocapsa sp. PCC 73106 TaxID=102232 RepID=UPI0002AC89EB|nr:arginine--tRNA ligase [Gloeocapsa sp. PCC 73106]ELR99843.1 arginyl-tRNA synthetase [Gloeocapsa sp. PCC 73106]